jgi:hypothetical protein
VLRRLPLLCAALAAFATGLVLAFAFSDWVLPSAAAPLVLPRPDTAVIRRARVVARNDMPDAAVAVFDSVTPRIYLNIRLLAQVGPDLAAFLRAHEDGHLAYHHVPERRFGLARVETPAPVLHGYEFAADCYAAQVLRDRRPSAVRAALRFFQQRRELVTDAAHPPMGARADSMIDCLTDPARRLRP